MYWSDRDIINVEGVINLEMEVIVEEITKIGKPKIKCINKSIDDVGYRERWVIALKLLGPR